MTRHCFLIVGAFLALGTFVGHLAAQEFAQDRLPDNHLVFTLHRTADGFRGANEYLPGFEIAMVISRDGEAAKLVEAGLVAAVRGGLVTGTLTHPNGTTTEIDFELVQHRGTPDIYMKTRLGFFLWERVRVNDGAITFVIDFWYTPPAVQADLEAVDLATELLRDPSGWLREDDRSCKSETWSLFCALKYATGKTLGEYNHHGKASSVVRTIIEELSPGVVFEHPLMDYNNAAETTHADVLKVLSIARDRLARELVDSRKPHRLRYIGPGGFPSWSPDGDTIVYARGSGGDEPAMTGLWMVYSHGGEPSRLTDFIAEHPGWSPDGSYIVYDAEQGNSIQLIAAEGGQPVRVVPDSIHIFRGGNPNWSPDASHLAFREGSNLRVLDLTSGEAKIVLTEPGKLPIPGCWSNDGTEFYVTLRQEDTQASTILTVSTTSNERRVIANDAGHTYRYMDLSPDGSLLAFASFHQDNLDIWVMSADGGTPIRITTHPAYDDTPRWSPDGRRLAFTSTRSGDFGVWIADLDLELIRRELRAVNP